MPHDSILIRSRRSHQQVIVVAHQSQCMDLHIESIVRLFKRLKKRRVAGWSVKYLLTCPSTIHHMI